MGKIIFCANKYGNVHAAGKKQNKATKKNSSEECIIKLLYFNYYKSQHVRHYFFAEGPHFKTRATVFKQWESVNIFASILVKIQPHYHSMSIPKRFNEITVKFS